MKIYNFSLTFLFLLAFVVCGAAQIKDEKQPKSDDEKTPVQWDRIEIAGGELSLEMPANPVYFYDKLGFRLSHPDKSYNFPEMKVLTAAADNTIMTVEIYDVSDPKGCLKDLVKIDRIEGTKTTSSPDGFNIYEVEQTEFRVPRADPVEIFRVTKYISSKTRLYVITTANRGPKSATAEKFLSSVRLNKEKAAPVAGEKVVSITDLTPVTMEQMTYDAREVQPEDLLPKPATPKPDAVKNPTPLLILTKPQPTYTEPARNNLLSGNMRMRITLSKKGNISKVLILTALPDGLSRNSFFAAMRVKFIPEENEGKPVTISKTVEYGFMIF